MSLCDARGASQIGPGAPAECPLRIGGCGHGTHVAGIAPGNRTARRGVASGAGPIAIKVFHREPDPLKFGDFPAPCTRTRAGGLIRALEHVARPATPSPPSA